MNTGHLKCVVHQIVMMYEKKIDTIIEMGTYSLKSRVSKMHKIKSWGNEYHFQVEN